MENQTQVPVVKIAKVGERRRKNGFAPFLPGFLGGGSSAAPWATGGLSLGAKMAIMFTVSTLGVGAYQVGKTIKPAGQSSAGAAGAPSSDAFQSQPNYGKVSGLPTNHPWYQNSLGMVESGGIGSSGNQGAGNAAANSGSAASGEASSQAGQAQTGAVPAGSSPLDSLAQKIKAANAGKVAGANAAAAAGGFGQGQNGLGSGGFGSGNNGMSGSSSNGMGSSGFGSRSGGSNFALGKFPVQPAGKAAPFGQSYSGGKIAAGGALGSGSRGFGALSQAKYINGQNTQSANPQMASAAAGQGFDNGIGGSGGAVTGAGIGSGGGTAPAPSQDNTGVGNNGGPTNGGSYNGFGSTPNTGGGAPTPTPGGSAAPWAGLVSNAGNFLKAAMILLLIAAVLGAIGKYYPVFFALAEYVAWAAAALAALATLMGVAMIGMGQSGEGIMITVLGGIVTAASAIVAMNSTAARTSLDALHNTSENFEQRMISEFTGNWSPSDLMTGSSYNNAAGVV
ncbi:MAG: hypothetical protein ACYCPQ_01060 [Elusimicrobiota bacterium]